MSKAEPKINKSQALIEMITDDKEIELWMNPDEIPFISFPNSKGITEHHPLESTRVFQWLARRLYKKKKVTASTFAIKEALAVIIEITREGETYHATPIRTGIKKANGMDSAHYIDLCNKKREAIKIEKDVPFSVGETPVRFRRTAKMKPLPHPLRPTEEHPGELSAFLNVSDEQLLLVKGFLLQAMRPEPIAFNYPILVLTGAKGAAKTSAARLIARIIDPLDPALLTKPRSLDDFFVAVNGSHLLVWDNLSGISREVSDAMCQVITGLGYSKRKQYTDGDEYIIKGTRPMIVNGIGDIVREPDLLDRSIIVELDVITGKNRKEERELDAAYEAELPYILWNLIKLYQKGLANFEKTKLAELPRMADFARWGTAALGNDFLIAYEKNIENTATEVALESSPIYTTLVETIRKDGGRFKGSITELYDKLTATFVGRSPKWWPNDPRSLRRNLLDVQAVMESKGHKVNFRKSNGQRLVEITLAEVDELPF